MADGATTVATEPPPIRPSNAAIGMRLLLHAMKRPERVPLMLQAYGCTPHLSIALLVYPAALARCRQHVRQARSRHRACWDGCACVAALAEPSHMHVNIAHVADGTTDLLYAHADMYLNISALSRELRGGNATTATTATPAGGLMLSGRAVEPGCVPVAQMPYCHGQDNGNRTCGGRTWAWWSHSDASCRMAAVALGLEACCYGWSDLVYLPRAAQHAFRSLATGTAATAADGGPSWRRNLDDGGSPAAASGRRWPPVRDSGSLPSLRRVFHEVAIPTALHHMRQRRWGGVGWRRIRCVGSCCTGVNGPAFARAAPLQCAHKIYLPALAAPSQSSTSSSRRYRPYEGFWSQQACRSALLTS